MANRTIGKVTTATATGGGIGAALAAVLIWALTQAGVDAGELEAPITVILTAVVALVGGWLVPSPAVVQTPDPMADAIPDDGTVDEDVEVEDPERMETEADREVGPKHLAEA